MKFSVLGPALVAAVLALAPLSQQALADDGPLDPSPPKGVTAEELIQRFTAKEKEFKEEREHYGYRQTVTITADQGPDTGVYEQKFDVSFDDKGNRVKNVVYSPATTIQTLTREDFDDIETRLPFTLSSDELPDYNVLYVGMQTIDELHCYVFDIAPKQFEKNKRYFQGRLWVDDKDMQIVRNTGKSVPDIRKKNNENLFPKFTTWREQIDGKYWFPTYSLSDDVLHFRESDQHIREVVKYTNYQRFGANVKITYEGKEIQKQEQQEKKDSQNKDTTTPPPPDKK